MFDPTLPALPVEFATATIDTKDFILGGALALALRRGRLDAVLDKLLPTPEREKPVTDTTDE